MKRVLIMEDNIDLAMEWAAAFELNQCEVTLCNNVEDAIGFLENESFDLLITDLFVKEQEGGFHLLRKLNLNPEKKVPTIAVTGARIPQNNDKDKNKNVFLESATLLGASSYIQKPFPAAELVVMAHTLWEH